MPKTTGAKKLPDMSVFLLIIISMVTYGIYMPFWFFNRRDALNNLKSDTKISDAVIIIAIVMAIISGALLVPSYRSWFAERLDGMISLAQWVVFLVLSFQVRRMLMDHYKIPISGIWTFLFSIFYLQYKINRLNEIYAKK